MSGVWGSSLKFAFPSTNVLKKSTSTFNNSMQCIILPITTGLQGSAPGKISGSPGLPKHFSWGAWACKLVTQINKSVSC